MHSGSGATLVDAEVSRIDQASTRPRNYSWAELMRRVCEIDVLECPECGSPMRILAAIHPPEAAQAILECLDMPSRSPPLLPPAPNPLTDLEQGF